MGEGGCILRTKQVFFKHGACQMWSKLQEVDFCKVGCFRGCMQREGDFYPRDIPEEC